MRIIEGDAVTPEMLKSEWQSVLSTFELFIEGGYKFRPIKIIIHHIISRGYDTVLFPGSSMYSLLISLPTQHQVNFNKTLRIEYLERTQLLQFRFIDWTNIDRSNKDNRPQIVWSETAQATEGIDLLEYFFDLNQDFKQTVRSVNKI